MLGACSQSITSRLGLPLQRDCPEQMLCLRSRGSHDWRSTAICLSCRTLEVFLRTSKSNLKLPVTKPRFLTWFMTKLCRHLLSQIYYTPRQVAYRPSPSRIRTAAGLHTNRPSIEPRSQLMSAKYPATPHLWLHVSCFGMTTAVPPSTSSYPKVGTTLQYPQNPWADDFPWLGEVLFPGARRYSSLLRPALARLGPS